MHCTAIDFLFFRSIMCNLQLYQSAALVLFCQSVAQNSMSDNGAKPRERPKPAAAMCVDPVSILEQILTMRTLFSPPTD